MPPGDALPRTHSGPPELAFGFSRGGAALGKSAGPEPIIAESGSGVRGRTSAALPALPDAVKISLSTGESAARRIEVVAAEPSG